MRDSEKLERRDEIEQVALKLIIEDGYRSASLLRVAKQAKCSTETVYRWYGSKRELLAALVKSYRATLVQELWLMTQCDDCKVKVLEAMGAAVLDKLLAPESVALLRAVLVEKDSNRTYVSVDSSMEALLAEWIESRLERQAMVTLLKGEATRENKVEVVDTFMSLLIGDLLIRSVFGDNVELSKKQSRARSRLALEKNQRVYSGFELT